MNHITQCRMMHERYSIPERRVLHGSNIIIEIAMHAGVASSYKKSV